MKFLRKHEVAARYGVTERTVDYWAEHGRLHPPFYRGTRFPLWDQDILDKQDRAAVLAAVRKQRVPERQGKSA